MLQSDSVTLSMNIAVRTDVDDLRGPGSAMTEAIPGPSPYPLSADSPYDSRSHQSEWVVEDEDKSIAITQEQARYDSDEEEDLQDQAFHLVIVGSDLPALSAALAVANSHPSAKVTLVTFGINDRPELVDNDDPSAQEHSQALLLTEQSVNTIQSMLSGKISGEDPHDQLRSGALSEPAGLPATISEGFENSSKRIGSISLRKYDNEELLNEDFSTEEPLEAKRARSVIKSDILLNIFLDACNLHPRIEVRSRAVVNALHLSAANAPPPQAEDHRPDDPVDFDTRTMPVRQSSDNYGVLHGLGRMARLAASGNPRRSFIYLSDEGGNSTSTINLLDKLTTDLDRSLRVASLSPDGGSAWYERPSPSQDSPVSLKDMQFDRRRPQAIKNTEAMQQTSPVVVLTSGEMIVADAVLGSSSAPSKVIDFVSSSSRTRGRSISCSTASWRDPLQGYEVYRAHIVLDGNTDDSELQQISGTSNMTIWANTEVQFTLIPLDNSKLYEVCIWHRVDEGPAAHAVSIESGEDAAQQMRKLVDGWCNQVVKLASRISSASYTLVYEHPFTDAWSDESHNVVLIGDAAHSLLPYGHVWTSAALEDAATLGSLFSTFSLSSAHQNQADSEATGVSDILRSYISLILPRHTSLHDTLGEGVFGPDIISSVYSRIIWSHVGIPSGQVSENEP
ncbi:hypothetical protein SCHPADRAFT_936355 [Schizopora paradoxa]|uniref:FAD-binding domain-containing protein n=1 Tax=Schizopora paradoxa TaxID=27342 RepID=A0A0H2S1Q6_9AGAM|nr:hypothetical protein SCHPADRAFT_936355 [Schizopora paradoxa]